MDSSGSTTTTVITTSTTGKSDSRTGPTSPSGSSSSSTTSSSDSWVELDAGDNRNSGESSPTPSVEKLLVDAQKESGQTSPNSSGTTSSKDSLDSPPLSNHSGSPGRDGQHAVPPEQLTRYIRDWSSRPEIIPPSDYGLKYEQAPRKKKHPLSVRNTRVMKDDWFGTPSIFTTFATHSACIVIGVLLGVYYTRNPGSIRG